MTGLEKKINDAVLTLELATLGSPTDREVQEYLREQGVHVTLSEIRAARNGGVGR